MNIHSFVVVIVNNHEVRYVICRILHKYNDGLYKFIKSGQYDEMNMVYDVNRPLYACLYMNLAYF